MASLGSGPLWPSADLRSGTIRQGGQQIGVAGEQHESGVLATNGLAQADGDSSINT
jgi:hypothetical protein